MSTCGMLLIAARACSLLLLPPLEPPHRRICVLTGARRYMCGASSVSQADSMARMSRISYLPTGGGGAGHGATFWEGRLGASTASTQSQSAPPVPAGVRMLRKCALPLVRTRFTHQPVSCSGHTQTHWGHATTQPQRPSTHLRSPAGVVLLRGIEADPLGPAAEQHGAVVYPQLGSRCLAASRAHKAVHRCTAVVLVWGWSRGFECHRAS